MNPPLEMPNGGGDIDTRLLDAMQFAADPLADAAVARIVGRWVVEAEGDGDPIPVNRERWERIAAVNRAMASWSLNGHLGEWTAPAGLAPDLASALAEYLHEGSVLPPWADREKIARAETLFFDYGPLSCTLLFCASLPECYVVPDLADVLHVAGQLEQHTDYRIRMTAAMIFPIMMHGGLTQADGGGIAQILKVRLIHATIRNLVLRGRPEDAHAAVPPLPAAAGASARPMHHALFAHGWNTRERGLPCNQEELAYTLLTFSYVFLRGLRQLGLALAPADEEAYLHCWNVAGHVLGIRRDLMADTMVEAEALFAVMQARARTHPPEPDVRPGLGTALIATMSATIRLPIARHFPTVMTQRLVGPQVADELGIGDRAPLSARLLFGLLMGVTRPIDAVVRLWSPEFALSRLVTRVLGYHVMSSLLLDQTRPLKLPDHVLNGIDDHMASWSDDRHAPRWINRLEDRLTTVGSWRRGHRPAAR